MSFGRLESQALVVPTGGWTADVNDGHAFTITIAAGTYSPTTLATAVEAALEAGAGSTATYSFSIDNGEGGTGRLVITCDAAFTVTWTSTDLRDALGYTGNLASSATQAATYGMRGLWLPNCPINSQYGVQDAGHLEGGPTQTVSPQGVVKTITRPTRTRSPRFTWSHITANRARKQAEASETVGGVTATPRSFERFLRDTMFGEVSYFTPGGAVRLIWDSGTPGTYTDYYPIAPKNTAQDRVDANWAGLYTCVFEGYKL